MVRTFERQAVPGAAVYHITSPPAASPLAQVTEEGLRSSRRRARVTRGAVHSSDSDVQLLQDLEFPGACARVRSTPSGTHLVAVGTYPPQLRVYEFAELGLKFVRHLDAAPVDLLVLADDWRKLAVLRNDRFLELHAQSGLYEKVRIPHAGRALAYHPSNCDVFIAAAGSRVYRLNLDEGRFLPPIETLSESNETMQLNSEFNLIGVGGDAGLYEVFDPRTEPHARAGCWNPSKYTTDLAGSTITSAAFRGLHLSVGLDDGTLLLYDIRSAKPLGVRSLGYNLPVQSINFHTAMHEPNRSWLIAADRKCVKIFAERQVENAPFLSFETPADIEQVEASFGGAGLLMAACVDRPIHCYFIPALGPAPKWCAYLEHLTEELAEHHGLRDDSVIAIYDHYKFVTREELTILGLDSLLGSERLMPHLHGFLMELSLYRKARAAANPVEYEEWRKQRIRERLASQQEQRIRAVEAKSQRLSKGHQDQDDERFQERFTRAEYAVDESHERWRRLHSSAKI
ncbi:Nucleolar protein 10 [Cyanidiococcus yangmingshanensis]|uniref:Nucleolar protein 10 n=1 Tax=Cyanidiococcus yangmingshanensis TaxID=2690220 RepID=A0A7J7IKU5_9RHOD|nr:Nucleolar protein 10 [Cyanidiococcus yangmingshanensis]